MPIFTKPFVTRASGIEAYRNWILIVCFCVIGHISVPQQGIVLFGGQLAGDGDIVHPSFAVGHGLVPFVGIGVPIGGRVIVGQTMIGQQPEGVVQFPGCLITHPEFGAGGTSCGQVDGVVLMGVGDCGEAKRTHCWFWQTPAYGRHASIMQ